VALPPPFVTDVKPIAVPEFVVVALALAFWPACGVILGKKAPAFSELVQVLSVAVVVQANCAAAGELATITRKNRTPAHCLRMRSRLRRQEAQSAYYRQ
jgi:hypothetical protein